MEVLLRGCKELWIEKIRKIAERCKVSKLGEDFEWCTLAKHGMKNFIEWLELDMCTFGHRPLGVSYLFTDMDHLCHMIAQ